ncbi:MAG: hypothetical protein LCH34_02285 [Firmicutes bacterium]|nr:hypothetical protein [Bacillota bacterium]
MNAFKNARFKKSWLWILMVLLVVFLVQSTVGIDGFSQGASFERVKTVEDAIKSAAIQCYAIEGSYPDFDYLVENYGIIINEKAYFYHYEIIASNILPVIAVYKKW